MVVPFDGLWYVQRFKMTNLDISERSYIAGPYVRHGMAVRRMNRIINQATASHVGA